MIESVQQIEPIADRILIKPVEQTLLTPGGLEIPEEHKNLWEILAVGSGVKSFDVGDYAMLSRQPTILTHLAVPLPIAGKSHLIIKEEHLVCKVKPPGKITLVAKG